MQEPNNPQKQTKGTQAQKVGGLSVTLLLYPVAFNY